MRRRGSMPTRKKIFYYWSDKIETAVDDNTCFKCGFTVIGSTAVERAHIKASCDGGTEELDNLHLLCKNCHIESELLDDELYWFWFNDNSSSEFEFKLRLSAKIYFMEEVPEDWIPFKESLLNSDIPKDEMEKLLRKFLTP